MNDPSSSDLSETAADAMVGLQMLVHEWHEMRDSERREAVWRHAENLDRALRIDMEMEGE